MTTAAKMDRLCAIFGSATEIAAIAGVTLASVSRWRSGTYQPSPAYQARLLREARRRRLDPIEIAGLLDIRRCGHCGEPIDKVVRDALR